MTQKLYILTFLLAFGFSIEGECIEGDCKNGQGTYIYGETGKYTGEWKDNNRHGRGNHTYPDGTSDIGLWFNNSLVERKIFTEVIKYLKAKYPESSLLSNLFKDY